MDVIRLFIGQKRITCGISDVIRFSIGFSTTALTNIAEFAAVRSKAVVPLLLIPCLLLLPSFVGVLCLDLILLCSFFTSFASILMQG